MEGRFRPFLLLQEHFVLSLSFDAPSDDITQTLILGMSFIEAVVRVHVKGHQDGVPGLPP